MVLLPGLDEVAISRLSSRETVLPSVDPSVSRLASAVLDTVTDGSLQVQKELSLFEFEASKAGLLRGVAATEIAQYAALDEQIESDIERTKREIELLKTSLQHERATRLHKEECEALSRTVNALPSRADSEREIARVGEELAQLRKQQSATDAQLDLRRRQFALLLQSIFELRKTLGEDEDGGAG